MHSNAPKDYICPICLGVEGIENEHTMLLNQDLIYSDEIVSVFINSFFPKDTPGHVIVVPNKHYETVYEMPLECLHKISEVAQKMAILLKKAYKCNGVKLVQNNEPAAGQHAFHYHMHVIPRFDNDNYEEKAKVKNAVSPEERMKYIAILKGSL